MKTQGVAHDTDEENIEPGGANITDRPDVLEVTHTDKADKDEEAAVEVLFSPPLYQQRYNLALQYLTQYGIKSVVDFGCSECGFFKLLPTVPSLTKVALVDVDQALLVNKQRVIEPELRHFVYRRESPLDVQLLAGSAADFDSRIAGFEAATLIEVIEHLYSDVLHGVTENIFGSLCPKLCIVTTPNSEFNPLFRNKDPTSFRHWDHKFEWTRQDFQIWCENICSRYNYQVEYTGVGFFSAKPETFHLGPCSQAAIFTAIDPHSEYGPGGNCDIEKNSQMCYELIAESNFPYNTCQKTREETIDLEIVYYLRQLSLLRIQGIAKTNDDDGSNEEEEQGGDMDKFTISIDLIASKRSLKKLCDGEEIRNRLVLNGFMISEDGQNVIVSTSDLLGHEEEEGYEEEEELQTNCNEERGDDKQKNDNSDNRGNATMGMRWESDWELTVTGAADNAVGETR